MNVSSAMTLLRVQFFKFQLQIVWGPWTDSTKFVLQQLKANCEHILEQWEDSRLNCCYCFAPSEWLSAHATHSLLVWSRKEVEKSPGWSWIDFCRLFSGMYDLGACHKSEMITRLLVFMLCLYFTDWGLRVSVRQQKTNSLRSCIIHVKWKSFPMKILLFV